MDYKGYKILAEINVNTQCEFEELPEINKISQYGEEHQIHITSVVDDGGVDEDNLADFIVYDPDGDDMGWADTLAEAKKLIDDILKNQDIA